MGTTARRVSRWIVNDGNYRSVGRRYAGAGYSKEEQRIAAMERSAMTD